MPILMNFNYLQKMFLKSQLMKKYSTISVERGEARLGRLSWPQFEALSCVISKHEMQVCCGFCQSFCDQLYYNSGSTKSVELKYS